MGTVTTNAQHQATITLPGSDFVDFGTYVVSGTVTDREGGQGQFSTNVVVNPVPEVLTVTGTSTIPEGSTATLVLGSAHPLPESVQYWVVNWGDGTVTQYPVGSTNPLATPPTTSTTVTHIYQTPGQYTVGLTAVDQDGPTSTSHPITVTDVAPSLTLNPVPSVTVGTPSVLTGSISEPGLGNSYSLSINWGDGTAATVIAVQQAQPQFELSHTYAIVGNYAGIGHGHGHKQPIRRGQHDGPRHAAGACDRDGRVHHGQHSGGRVRRRGSRVGTDAGADDHHPGDAGGGRSRPAWRPTRTRSA